MAIDSKSLLVRKDPDAGKDPAREDEGKRMRWLDGLTDSMDVNLSKFWDIVKDGEAWSDAAQEAAKCWTQLSE